MTPRIWTVLALVALTGLGVRGQAPDAPAALTPCETAEADVLSLRVRVLQLEAQLAAAPLEAERLRLEAQYRARLQPPAAYAFDWTSKTFKPPAPPATAPATPQP